VERTEERDRGARGGNPLLLRATRDAISSRACLIAEWRTAGERWSGRWEDGRRKRRRTDCER
jgi:hypothetical protein